MMCFYSLIMKGNGCEFLFVYSVVFGSRETDRQGSHCLQMLQFKSVAVTERLQMDEIAT